MSHLYKFCSPKFATICRICIRDNMSHLYSRQYVAFVLTTICRVAILNIQAKGEMMTDKILRPPTPKEIKDLRRDLKLTTTDAGNLIHISNRTFQRYERGNTPMPLAYWELFQLKCRVIKSRQGKMS